MVATIRLWKKENKKLSEKISKNCKKKATKLLSHIRNGQRVKPRSYHQNDRIGYHLVHLNPHHSPNHRLVAEYCRQVVVLCFAFWPFDGNSLIAIKYNLKLFLTSYHNISTHGCLLMHIGHVHFKQFT